MKAKKKKKQTMSSDKIKTKEIQQTNVDLN